MAILQIELDRDRLSGHDQEDNIFKGSPTLVVNLLCRALRDTIANGGTFVVVVSDTTITAVQHPDAKPLEAGA
jgi:hypothetical protein